MRTAAKTYSIILFMITHLVSWAQSNLLPNGSFENISQCPGNCIASTTSTLAIGWINPNNGSSDLFSPCDTQICVGWNRACNNAPNNCWGWQNAKAGSNYTGIAVYGAGQLNVREYIQGQLKDSLIQGKNYCVSFFTSRADSFSAYATSRLGCYLSLNAVNNFSQYLISAAPQIQNPFNNYISDNINWVEIKGIYNAIGGERFVTIGNFFDDNNTDTISAPTKEAGTAAAYYYIDDVSVVEYSGANAGQDTVICQGVKIKAGFGATFGAQYNWSIISGDINSIDSSQIASPLLTPSVTTVYALQKQQCGVFSYDTLIIHVPRIYPAITGADTTLCVGDTITLAAQNNCTWCTHSWNTGSTSLQIPISPVAATVYSFSQADSCFTTTDQVMVGVEYCYSPIISIPNIFTPNKDEINDTWLPIIQNVASIGEYSLEIYNRWGIQMFKTDKMKEGWDGRTTAGIECVEGTYYYVVEYTDLKTSQRKSVKGFLLLAK